jgi:hypothetical protein
MVLVRYATGVLANCDLEIARKRLGIQDWGLFNHLAK